MEYKGLPTKNRKNSQELNKDTFYRPPKTSAQCITGI